MDQSKIKPAEIVVGAMDWRFTEFGISKKTARAWAILALALTITFFVSWRVKQNIEYEAVREFADVSDQIALKVQERLHAYSLILKGGAGLFAASKTVDRQEWRAYVDALRISESIPGVQGVGFSLMIPAAQLRAHIANIVKEGYSEYVVRPPGAREVYTSIIFLEPFTHRNLRAFGFDMYSEPTRRAAMERARDTGEASLSGKVQLVQETNKGVQAGTLMYVPVYRNGAALETVEDRRAAILGWSYSPYRMTDLMIGMFAGWEHESRKDVVMNVYDGDHADAQHLLFTSHESIILAKHSLFEQQRSINFGGRQWLLTFDHVSGGAAISYSYAWATLIGGMGLSLLLFFLRLTMINTQINAQQIAARLTQNLQRSHADIQRFAEVTAHHLQEPARRIATYADRLNAQLEGQVKNSEVGYSITFLTQEARRQQNLLRDVERYLAADQPRGKMEYLDANVVVAELLTRWQKGFTEAGAAVTVDTLPWVRLDHKRLLDVFDVLIANAIQHGKREEPLLIRISAEQIERKVRFSVSDNGPGVAAEYRERVFRVFERLKSEGESTGIGLAIVRRIIESCGGRVWMDEAVGGGCRVYFELPTGE